MRPKQVVQNWVAAFNKADAVALAEFYHEDAINHQVANEPIVGKHAIRKMFSDEFSKTTMVCIVENIFEDRDWASLNGKIPKDFEVAASFKLKMEKLNSKGAIGTNYHFSDRTICQFQK